jgi:hypothetical protein
MAGFMPAIHVFRAAKQDVDGRDKPGHDEALVAAKVMSAFLTALKGDGARRHAPALSESARPFSLQMHAIMVALRARKRFLSNLAKADRSAVVDAFELIRGALVIDSNCSN